jgi:hypothetical protein
MRLIGVLGRVVRMGVFAEEMMVVDVDFMVVGVGVFDFACYEECG